MNTRFECNNILEYTATYRIVNNIKGVNIEKLDLYKKTLDLSGINDENKSMVCNAMYSLGWKESI